MMKMKWWSILSILVVGLTWTCVAVAQVTPSTLVPPAGFNIIGFIQEATLDGTVAGTAAVPLPNNDPRAGGTLTINGIKMLVPNNTFVQLPANAMSWGQLFQPAQALPVGTYTPARRRHPVGSTGLALADRITTHFPSFEATVLGNIVPDPVTGAPQYIVGLIVPISQHSLMGAFGIINYIDHDGTVLGMPGRFRVGGVLNDPATGTLVEINDPVGRWGVAHSPDPRFTTDTSNPTVLAESGYPVCIPRVAPPGVDPECPVSNRPLNPAVGDPAHDPWIAAGEPLKTFNMPASAAAGTTVPDPWKQVPLMVGDTVDVSGTVMKIDPVGPDTAANQFISAHTVVADLGIFTQPGVQPCYVRVEAILMPTAEVRNTPVTIAGDPPTSIPLENSTRAVVVGFTTDPSQLVDIFAIDIDPLSGAETERLIATVLPETLAPGLVRGRFRFTPSRATGTFPATRDYIAKSRTGQIVAANGLTTGQYRLPNFEFLFAERTVFGAPTVPFDFASMPFLRDGTGPLAGDRQGRILGRLDPWPGDPLVGVAAALAGPAVQTGEKVVPVVDSATQQDVTGMPRPRGKR